MAGEGGPQSVESSRQVAGITEPVLVASRCTVSYSRCWRGVHSYQLEDWVSCIPCAEIRFVSAGYLRGVISAADGLLLLGDGTLTRLP